MSTARISTNIGFDNREFWISNTGESTHERFSGLVSATGIPLLGQQERTYSTFAFEANGLTYRYVGSFTLSSDSGLLGGSVSAEGSYDRIEIRAGGTLVATYEGPSRMVDFGTYGNLGLVGNLLDTVTGLLFGSSSGRDAYANLHTDATPNLPALAYADGVTATGGGGDDTLYGGAGADSLDGAGGTDRLYGLGGNDTYFVRDAGDRAYETAGNGNGDLVKASVSYSLAGQAIERLTLTGNADLTATGNDLANTLTGNAGDNKLNGTGGADRMEGLAGNDIYYIDSAGDRVIETAGNGRDFIVSTVDVALNNNSNDEIEVVSLVGTTDIDATGNRLANSIAGNAGDNVLNGKLGSDLLMGRGGSDSFVFDTQPVSKNVDRIVDFARDDTVVLENAVFTGLAAGRLAAGAFKAIGNGEQIDANDRILYNQDTGALFYDRDGSGVAEAVRFASLQSLPGLTADEFLII